MKIAAERLKSAKARKKETAASYGPVLSGSMSWLKRNESEGSAGIASLSPTFRYFIADELYDAKLSLSQPLFMWGKIKEANRQASFGYNMAQEDMETAKKDTLFKVQEAFYRVILGRQLVRIARGSRDIADRQLKVVESFYNEGKSSSYDVGRVKVALANVKTNLIRAENGYELALQALENLLDMKSGEADFEGEMTDPGLEFKLDTLVDESIRNRPEIRRIVLAEKSAASLVRMTAAGNRPNLLAAGASEWQNTGFSTNDPYHTWSAMLVLNVPIFDGWSTRQRTKQARSNLEEVRHTRSSLEEV
ncbi:MAG TPA: TolC family protein, partial [bacterium]|nr:TolC family protein [bacterium]